MKELHLFAGIGGGILGGMILGHTCVGAVEIDPYCQEVLRARQQNGLLPDFPVWGDITTFDGIPWKGMVDIVAGGFPCQDISSANQKAQGISGSRSGLWSEMARVVREVQPRYVFVENVPALLSRGIHRVLGDLAAMGFDAEWGVFSAADVGAPHLRKRLWILAYSSIEREESGERGDGRNRIGNAGEDVANPMLSGLEKRETQKSQPKFTTTSRNHWWTTEPRLGRVVNGGTRRVDRIKGLGNAQVPLVAAYAFHTLMNRINHESH